MMKLKRRILFLTMHGVRLALRLYGWRTCARTDGFKADPQRPFWRLAGEKLKIAHAKGVHIETADFAGAVNLAIQEIMAHVATKHATTHLTEADIRPLLQKMQQEKMSSARNNEKTKT
jgi:hypothetical protein